MSSLFAMLPKKNASNYINEKDQRNKQIKKRKNSTKESVKSVKMILGNVALNSPTEFKFTHHPLYSGDDCINLFISIEIVSNYWLYINCFPLKKHTLCN